MGKKEGFRSVLIFGGAGFIGSNWTARLLETTEAKVHVYDNLSRRGSRSNLAYLQKLAGRSGRLQITIGDIRDREMVTRATRAATEIYQLAAQVAVTTSVADPRLDFEVNAGGTFNILEGARQSGRNPFVLFTSTNKVYGDIHGGEASIEGQRYVSEASRGTSEAQPLDFHSPYGCSKGTADQYVRDYGRIYGLPTAVVRMSCIAGPRQFGNEDQGWVAHFLYSALTGEPVTIYGSGHQVRDILHVDDLLDAFAAIQERSQTETPQLYNVGGGAKNSISLLELRQQIEAFMGKKLECLPGPVRPGDQKIYVTDHARLTSATGWNPRRSIAEILEDIHAFFRSNRELFAQTRATVQQIPMQAIELPRTA